MRRLLQFFYKYRAFFVFLLLEIASGWLIVNHNAYLSASYFNASNTVAASIYNSRQNIVNYFGLRAVNARLAAENQKLMNLLSASSSERDSIFTMIPRGDSMQYKYVLAKVVNNSVDRFRNYITIDKGSLDSIKVGMGLINDNGVIGRVMSVSDRYATAYSLLHTQLLVSAKIEATETICTASWKGEDPSTINLDYVPRHVPVKRGMRIVTSGYNSIFPEGVLLGKIKNVELAENAPFYELEVELAVEFHSLNYIYAVENAFANEKDSLEIETIPADE